MKSKPKTKPKRCDPFHHKLIGMLIWSKSWLELYVEERQMEKDTDMTKEAKQLIRSINKVLKIKHEDKNKMQNQAVSPLQSLGDSGCT